MWKCFFCFAFGLLFSTSLVFILFTDQPAPYQLAAEQKQMLKRLDQHEFILTAMSDYFSGLQKKGVIPAPEPKELGK